MARVSLFTVRRAGPGAISTVARPRGNDWLEDELFGIRSAGVDVLVSMLTLQETLELGLLQEAEIAKAAGLRFISLPTLDRGLPDRRLFFDLLEGLGNDVARGMHVAAHCRSGIGRSSLVAVGLLIREGMGHTAAWEAMRAARGLEVPDTPEQRAWLQTIMTTSGLF